MRKAFRTCESAGAFHLGHYGRLGHSRARVLERCLEADLRYAGSLPDGLDLIVGLDSALRLQSVRGVHELAWAQTPLDCLKESRG